VKPLTRGLLPPDPQSLCPLSSDEFVEPAEKIPGYATVADRVVPTRVEDKLLVVSSSHSRRLGVVSGATAPGPALEGAPRFRPKVVLMSLSSYILR
jgi:hypothetical protein